MLNHWKLLISSLAVAMNLASPQAILGIDKAANEQREPLALSSEVIESTKEVHLFEVENPANNSSLLILGSHHCSRIARLPTEVVHKFCSSDFIIEECADADDKTAKLIVDEFILRIQPHGLYKNGPHAGYLDLFLGDIPEGAKGWFDIIKPNLKPEQIKRLNEQAKDFEFNDSSDMLNCFHPLAWQLFTRHLEEMTDDFAEEQEGMDRELCKIFRTANKPVMHFETILDRFKISLNFDFISVIQQIAEKLSFDHSKIAEVIESNCQLYKEPASFKGRTENVLILFRKWLAALIHLKAAKEGCYSLENDEGKKQQMLIEISKIVDQIEALKRDIADKEQLVEIDAPYLTGQIIKKLYS